jgi:hypothetical protein
MRRRSADPVDVPAELLRFNPAEWPGDLAPGHAWSAARLAFAEAHAPALPLGDLVTRLRFDLAERRRHDRDNCYADGRP